MRAGWIVSVALAIGVVAGCTGSESESLIVPTSASPKPVHTPVPEEIFGETRAQWRSTQMPGNNVANLDQSAHQGQYELRVYCENGRLKAWANAGPKTVVRCAGQIVTIPVCNRRDSLMAHAIWITRPHGYLAWELVKRGDVCTPLNRDKT